MSELALELIEENKRTKNPFLDLGTCGLKNYLPNEMFDCIEWITKLSLGEGYYGFEKSGQRLNKNEKNTNIFDGKELQVLSKFKGLKLLGLNGTQIKDGKFLEQLNSLQTLDITNTQIKDYKFLEKLLNLQSLWLIKNQIFQIDFLKNLTNLHTLRLYNNNIRDISVLKNLTNLEILDFGKNNITDISFLENLTKLSKLDLDGNTITTISHLRKLINLKYLNLSNNQVTDIQPLLVLLKNGLELSIEEDYISVPSTRNVILLRDNPIKTPPLEIIRQGREAVINWFEEIEKQGEEMVYEAKLMIIGDAGSGKTSLATKLKNIEDRLPDKVKETTVGIEISQLDFLAKADKPHFKVNIWDLGGQKIYHPLHQLFFTQRSLYVLVSNGRNDTDENDLTDFWIPAQELLARDSPMLILFNKHGDIQPNMAFRNFQLQYPNIKGDLAIVDLLNDKPKTVDFIEDIEKYMRNLPQFVRGEKLPKLWAKIRETIAQRTENYIPLQEFRNVCSNEDLKEPAKQDFLSDYLHDLGIILRFREDPLLNGIVFLNPQWALDAIYKVLDHTREHNNGLFNRDELLCVWQKPEFYDVQDALLALMLKFELCYRTNDSPEQYLVPSLLAKDVPDGFGWEKTNSVCLYYEYDFMPKGIISRLIVRLNTFIDKNKLLWREGVVFEFMETSAWLTKPNKNRIEIYARGYKPSYLISLITKEVDDINSKYHFSERSKPKKYVPCICEVCKVSANKVFHNYEELIERDQLGKRIIECRTPPYHEVNVKALLENVESKKSSVSNAAKKIFVAYSQSDEAYKVEFKKHMVNLERQKLAEIFDDRQIDLGNQWDEVLKQKIDECDYFVCLISVDFLNVGYIYDEEIPIAVRQGKKVIPIIIKPCDWIHTPIKDFDANLGSINAHNKGTLIGLSEEIKNGKAIPREYTKTERDSMWLGVVNAIRGLIEKDK